MATAVTICNLALSHIGDSATISSIDPPDGTAQAEACSRLYPLALSTALDMHNWAFATRRVDLPKMAEGSVEKGPWRNAFALPSDCKRLIDLRETGMDAFVFHPPKAEWEVVGDSTGLIVLTNCESVTARYVCSDPKPSQFTGLFTDALAWLLGSYLAGETIRGDSASQYVTNCMKMYQTLLLTAQRQDARQTERKPRHVPSWIARR